MGAAVGTDSKGSVNVELNIIPFIDLMSCLTAFLLVAAVWVNIAQINIAPKGRTRDTSNVEKETDDPTLSVLVQHDKITIGVSKLNEFQEVGLTPAGALDWEKFETTMKAQKASVYFQDRTDMEIAAESTSAAAVDYQAVVTAMDIALKVGFKDVGLSDPAGLAARPTY